MVGTGDRERADGTGRGYNQLYEGEVNYRDVAGLVCVSVNGDMVLGLFGGENTAVGGSLERS